MLFLWPGQTSAARQILRVASLKDGGVPVAAAGFGRELCTADGPCTAQKLEGKRSADE